MVDNFNLEVNDKLEVMMGDRVYKALVLDVEEDFLRINLPVNNGEYLILNSGEEIEINSYFDENKCFSFSCEVLSRGRERSIIYYTLSKPFDIKKIQRRNFFRVGLTNEIQYKVITNIDEEDIENVSYKKGLMLDLSAGGLKLKAKEDIKKSDLLLVNLKLNEIQFELKCDIVRIENTADKQKLCGLKFTKITQAESEKIIQELFEVVRKQRANDQI